MKKAQVHGVGQVGGTKERHRFGGSLNLHIHAHVLLMAGLYETGEDRDLLERVCRDLLRGPLAHKRQSQRPDGMLVYRLKKPDRGGNTVLVRSLEQPLMRTCSLWPRR